MNDLSVLDEFVDVAGHAVVKSHTDRQHQIGFIDGDVGVLAAVHPQAMQCQRMAWRKGAVAHQGGGDRACQAFGKLQQLAALLEETMPPPA